MPTPMNLAEVSAWLPWSARREHAHLAPFWHLDVLLVGYWSWRTALKGCRRCPSGERGRAPLRRDLEGSGS